MGFRIACPEAIAFRAGALCPPISCCGRLKAHDKSSYGQYLQAIYDAECKSA
jgi:hypothetical protein